VPLHCGADGLPNGYGSPWVVFGLVTGLAVFFIILAGFLDELWSRQEKAKSFKWLAMLDEIVVGSLAGNYLGYLTFLRSDGSIFSFPWQYLVLFGGGALMLAVILELVRPYRPVPGQVVSRENLTLKTEMARRLEQGASFTYWDYQNPAFITVLTILLPLIMLGGTVLTWSSTPWVSVVVGIAGLLSVFPYGGLRTRVTRQNLSLRFGILGFRLLNFRIADIATAEVHEFAPIRDFGGYGIRFNREMSAYFLRGTRGVKITANGKNYLIGSDDADRLAAVISAVKAGSH